jgi:hypothetical protein
MRIAICGAVCAAGLYLAVACTDVMGPADREDAAASQSVAVAVPGPDPVLATGDAWQRDFERWRPDFFNRRNYYTWPRARRDFNGYRLTFYAWGLSFLERRGRIVDDFEQGRVLRVTYPAGSYGASRSGVTFPWHLQGEYGTLELHYKVKFQSGFLFTTSGKLPGLCGANDDLGCWRYSGGNKPRGDDGFTVRPVWLNGDGLMGTYVYHAAQAGEFGDIFVWEHESDRQVHITRGEWHTIGLRVRLNDPGIANGEVEAWLDGERVSLARGLLFRDATARGRRISINEVYFNTFHGGRQQSDAPPQTQYAYFDELQLSAVVAAVAY